MSSQPMTSRGKNGGNSVSAAVLTTDEVQEALAALTAADLLRLKRAAATYAVGIGVEASDVINEAIRRALDGTRKCPTDLPLLIFLVGAMRSMAWAARESRKEEPMIESMSSTLDDGPVVIEPIDDNRNAEERLLAREDSQARLKVLETLFGDDEDAQLVIMGDLEEMDASQIRALGGWDESAYATIRRRMRRRINGAYPKGWVQ